MLKALNLSTSCCNVIPPHSLSTHLSLKWFLLDKGGDHFDGEQLEAKVCALNAYAVPA